MARPKKTLATVSKNIRIPEDLAARMELELYSELEGKIPYGAQHEFFTKLLREYFEKPQAAAAAAE